MLFMVWVGACVPLTWVMVVGCGVSWWCCFQCLVAVVSASRRVPGVLARVVVSGACSGVGGLVSGVVGVCACVVWLVSGVVAVWLVCVVWFRMLMCACASFLFFGCVSCLFG